MKGATEAPSDGKDTRQQNPNVYGETTLIKQLQWERGSLRAYATYG